MRRTFGWSLCAMAVKIKLLGKPAILGDDGEQSPVRGYQAWALLARAVLARQSLDRRTLAMELFADSADPLGALRWCLAALRKALNSSNYLTGDPIELKLPENTEVDVWMLEQDKLAADCMEPLLAGIEPQCGPEFSTWLLVERARFAALMDGKIRRETLRALAVQDHPQAIELASMAVGRDCFDEGAHVLLVKALSLSGAHNAALRHIEDTERLFQSELGTAPSQALRSAARLTVVSPPVGVSAAAHVKSLLRSGAAALSAGAVDAGIESLRQAVHEAEQSADHHLHTTAMLELGKGLVYGVRGFDEEGSVLLRQCSEVAQERGYAKIAANALIELGYVEALAARRPSAEHYLHNALAFVSDSGDFAELHAVTAFNLIDWGKAGDGLEHCSTSLQYGQSSGSKRTKIWTLGMGARGQLAVGDLDCASTWLADSLSLIDEVNWVSFRPWPVALMAETRLRQGVDAAKVRVPLEEAYALSCQLRDPCWEAACARALAMTFTAEGDSAVALEWLDAAHRSCLRETDPFVSLSVEILADKVDAYKSLGRNDEAVALSREWVALAARAHMDAHVVRAASFLAARSSA
jgi:DNA-binding SARP family transcriptional activator